MEYFYRKNRNEKTPFVRKKGKETATVTVGICRDDDGLLTVFTAFAGQLAPKEPWDNTLRDDEKETSSKFWSSHALAYDETAIDFGRC